MLVGEQPGDTEDREEMPFVGPAGRLLVAALREAGVDLEAANVTNVVKHVRFRTKGKQKIHATPTRWNVTACGPGLLAELDAVRPALEAPAGWGIAGQAPTLVATAHPSSVLRSRNRHEDQAVLVADLRVAAELLG